jgi:hypothetical protein
MRLRGEELHDPSASGPQTTIHDCPLVPRLAREPIALKRSGEVREFCRDRPQESSFRRCLIDGVRIE